MTRLHFDYEGRSEIDLFDRGADIYTSDLSTKILMASFKINDEATQLWVPAEGGISKDDAISSFDDDDEGGFGGDSDDDMGGL